MIHYIDRTSGEKKKELVMGGRALAYLYRDGFFSRFLRTVVSRSPIVSALYGAWQKGWWTKKKIQPFIDTFDLDATEFDTCDFVSFNDFFIRKLKRSARPLAGDDVVVPADGRYLIFPNLDVNGTFKIKNQSYDLQSLLQDDALAKRFAGGSLVIGRLCPSDYHRFHFPCDGIPGESRLIRGRWYSVNPIALEKIPGLFSKNKRTLCLLETETLGSVVLIEVGATNVGSIHQTYKPNHFVCKGDEKGYFSFGASTLLLIFEKGRIQFSEDLLNYRGAEEVRCLFGQPLAKKR